MQHCLQRCWQDFTADIGCQLRTLSPRSLRGMLASCVNKPETRPWTMSGGWTLCTHCTHTEHNFPSVPQPFTFLLGCPSRMRGHELGSGDSHHWSLIIIMISLWSLSSWHKGVTDTLGLSYAQCSVRPLRAGPYLSSLIRMELISHPSELSNSKVIDIISSKSLNIWRLKFKLFTQSCSNMDILWWYWDTALRLGTLLIFCLACDD